MPRRNFRRLTQDAIAFRRFAQQVRDQLSKDPAYGSITEEQVSAMFVGRWPNGTPLEVSPATSTPPNPTNDFEYLKDSYKSYTAHQRSRTRAILRPSASGVISRL
jgi:hypothetical protein